MKSLVITLFFIVIVYLNYKYSYNKYYTNNIEKEIEYIILPISVNDYFKSSNLKDDFKNIFADNKIDKNYKIANNTNGNNYNTISLQRFFTEF